MTLHVDISKRLVLINSASAIVTRALRVTLLIWMYQYLLRRISPDQFAVYAVVSALIVFAPLFSSFFTSGINRYVVEACARGDRDRATEVISSIVPLVAGWALLFGILGCVFAWHIQVFVNLRPADLADARLMMVLLVGDFALQMALTPFAAGFAVRQQFLLLNIVEIAAELLRMTVLFVLLFGVGPRVLWVVVASATANAAGGLAKTVVSLRLLPEVRVTRRLFRWETARELMSFGVWTSLNHLAGMIHINADIIVLNHLAAAADVAIFKLGSEFYNQVDTLVMSAALAPMRPVLTSLYAHGATERLGDAVLRSARYVLWFSLVMAIPLAVYRRQLVTLYAGSRYLPAADVLGVLVVLFFVFPAGLLLAPLSEAAARMKGLALANAIVQFIKLSVTMYFVGRLGLGALGCALSTLLVVGSAHVLILTPMTLRMAGVKWRSYIDRVIASGVPPALAGGAVWILLNASVMPRSWTSVGLCCAIGATAYVIALLAFALNSEERTELVSLLRAAGRRAAVLSRRAAPAPTTAA